MDNFDLLIENSINSAQSSNLTKIFEGLDEAEAGSTTANMVGYRALVSRVIQRLKQESDIEAFCSVIVPKTSTGVVPVFGEKLTGKQSDEKSVKDNLKIFKFDEAISDAVGDEITNGTATATILYKEDIFVLVEVTSGTFVNDDTVSTKNLDNIYSALHSMGVLLSEYTGEYSTLEGEELTDSNEVDLELILKETSCTTKDVRSKITKETLADLVRMYGVTYNNSIVKSLTTVLSDATRQRIFTYMRNNAVVRPDLILTNSYGTGAGIDRIYADIYARINQSIGAIGTNTGISAGKYTVIASSNVVAGIKTYLKEAITEKNGISYMPGNVTLIEDGYSTYDYLVVALRGPNNNSAVIHTPYDIVINSATDPDDFVERIVIKGRNDTFNNPLMDLAGSVKNPMMELTVVDMTNVIGLF